MTDHYFVIQHRSGDTIPTTKERSKKFETRQEAERYMTEGGLGGKVEERNTGSLREQTDEEVITE